MSISSAQLPNGFLRGGDVSEIPEVEAKGVTYSLNGKVADPIEILQKQGWNFVRFRVWNQPKDGWCDKEHTLAMAKRAKAHGMKISIDFHYSDWWADPGKQDKPAAWKELPFEDLVQAVHDYTKDVILALVAQGTPPIIAQIGNEIIGGMLWPEGRVRSDDPKQWQQLAKLINAGIHGVRNGQGRSRIKIMLHLDRGGDNRAAVWWFDHILAEKVKFDLIGLSYYPAWHGHPDALEHNLHDLATRYKKDIYVVETGYPWTPSGSRPGLPADQSRGIEANYPPTPEGQAAFLRKVISIIRTVPGGRGKGVLYWAPTWIYPDSTSGSRNALALFDEHGNSLPSVAAIGGR